MEFIDESNYSAHRIENKCGVQLQFDCDFCVSVDIILFVLLLMLLAATHGMCARKMHLIAIAWLYKHQQ